MNYALASAACLLLLQILLGFYVSMNRIVARQPIGQPEQPDHPLYRAIVAHRNACEYNPALAILLLLGPVVGQPAWGIWLGPLTLVARVLAAVMLVSVRLSKPHPLRILAAAFTYTLGSLLALMVLWTLTRTNAGGA